MPTPQEWMQMLRLAQQAQRGMGYPGMPSIPQLPGGLPPGMNNGPQAGNDQWRPPPSTMPGMSPGGLPGGLPRPMPGMPGVMPGSLPNFIPGQGRPPVRPWQMPLPGYNPEAPTMPQPPASAHLANGAQGPPQGVPPAILQALMLSRQQGTSVPSGAQGPPHNFPSPGFVPGTPVNPGIDPRTGQPLQRPNAQEGVPPAILQALQGTSVPSGAQGPPHSFPSPGFVPGTPVNPGINPRTGQPLQQPNAQEGFQAMIEELRKMYMGMPTGPSVDLYGRPIYRGA